jgi:N-acetylglutamate synthase-like GNAT family acetyltransferase
MADHVLREPRNEDWPAILGLANASVEMVAGAGPQDEWAENRRRFANASGLQRHWVAEATASGEVAGYAGIEQTSGHTEAVRIFVVTAPGQRESLGAWLLDAALAEARAIGATASWLMEYATDAEFIAFLKRHGFEEARQLPLPDGAAAVVLTAPVRSGVSPGDAAHRAHS